MTTMQRLRHGASLIWLLIVPLRMEAQAFTVRGLIQDSAGKPIAGASVIAGSRTFLADSVGRFVFDWSGPGPLSMRVRALGFAPVDTLIRAAAPSYLFRLRPGAQRLPEITTTELAFGKPLRYASTMRFDEFYYRRARKPGVFYTRDEIAATGLTKSFDLLRLTPGISVRDVKDRPELDFARCRGQKMMGVSDEQLVVLFVDGVQVGNATGYLQTLPLSEVETMEIYRGPSQLPMEAVGNACAAIVIHTRFGAEDRTPPTSR